MADQRERGGGVEALRGSCGLTKISSIYKYIIKKNDKIAKKIKYAQLLRAGYNSISSCVFGQHV